MSDHTRPRRISRRAFCAAGLAAGLGHRIVLVRGATPDVAEIGRRKQLFVDDRLVLARRGVELRLNRPELQTESLLVPERPWEAARVMAGALLSEEGRLRLWYASHEKLVETSRGGPGGREFVAQRVCYAESTDGVHFMKPELDALRLAAPGPNNCVMSGPNVSRIFRDPFDEPARRYKTLLSGLDGFDPRVASEWPSARGASRRVLYLAHSAEGTRWQVSPRPVLPITIGSDRCVFWDDRISKWVLYLRGHRPRNTFYVRHELDRDGWQRPLEFRRMPGKQYNELPTDYDRARAATDPVTRTVLLEQEFPVVLDVDDDDPPRAQVYSMNAWKHPTAQDVYLAFVPMWYAPPSASFPAAGSDRVEVQLAVSRDGVVWQRPWRMPLISPGVAGSGGAGQIWPLCEPIVREREIWLYYTALPHRHFDFVAPGPGQGFTARAVFRLDGFVSADAESHGGELGTVPLRFDGRVLRVNANAGAAGRLRVGVDDAEGRPIAGFGIDDARPVTGNQLSEVVAWKGGTDVGNLGGRPVRLRFAMDYCRLYGFQFGD
jgi:hypothetical protein